MKDEVSPELRKRQSALLLRGRKHLSPKVGKDVSGLILRCDFFQPSFSLGILYIFVIVRCTLSTTSKTSIHILP